MPDSRRKPGEIRDSIVSFLRGRDHGTISEICAAVEASVGTPVAASSVRSYLQLNEGTVFERVDRGKYRLKTP